MELLLAKKETPLIALNVSLSYSGGGFLRLFVYVAIFFKVCMQLNN